MRAYDNVAAVGSQVKYKEGVQQMNQNTLYHHMAETTETALAKEVSQLQSQVMSYNTFFLLTFVFQ